MKFASRSLALVLLATLLAALASHQVAASDAGDIALHADEPDIILHVKGLACENCARTMKEALLELDDVVDAQVFLDGEQHVNVSLRDGATVDDDALKAAVEGCGFVLERVEVLSGEAPK